MGVKQNINGLKSGEIASHIKPDLRLYLFKMELTGRVHEIGAKQQITDKITKQDLIILDESNAQYPEYIKIEALNAKCDLLNSLSPGQNITAHFNLKGRESKGNYYNSLQLWKIS